MLRGVGIQKDDSHLHPFRQRVVMVLSLTMLALVISLPLSAAPQSETSSFPEKEVRLIVPFGAGGGSDLMARTIGNIASEYLGQAVVVINRGGAGGAIGALEAKQADADGYTLLFGPSPVFTTVPQLRNVEYSVDDFVGVSVLTEEPVVVVVRADSEWETLDDLIAEANSGRRIVHGHGGAGSATHVAMMSFFESAGIEVEHIPYNGVGPARADLLGGHIDVLASFPPGIRAQVDSGDLRIIGAFAEERNKFLPDVPTFREKGFDIVVGRKAAIAVQSDTPVERVNILRDAFERAKASDEFAAFAEQTGVELNEASGEELNDILRAEYDYYSEALREYGLID